MNEGKKSRWTIATARQSLPTLVTLAAREPQEIYRRNELVARVVSAEAAVPAKRSARELLDELQTVCAEESYTLELPSRTSRPSPFPPARKSRDRKRNVSR